LTFLSLSDYSKNPLFSNLDDILEEEEEEEVPSKLLPDQPIVVAPRDFSSDVRPRMVSTKCNPSPDALAPFRSSITNADPCTNLDNPILTLQTTANADTCLPTDNLTPILHTTTNDDFRMPSDYSAHNVKTTANYTDSSSPIDNPKSTNRKTGRRKTSPPKPFKKRTFKLLYSASCI
jgi:hypothetical protein